jgi:hypothetical protein
MCSPPGALGCSDFAPLFCASSSAFHIDPLYLKNSLILPTKAEPLAKVTHATATTPPEKAAAVYFPARLIGPCTENLVLVMDSGPPSQSLRRDRPKTCRNDGIVKGTPNVARIPVIPRRAMTKSSRGAEGRRNLIFKLFEIASLSLAMTILSALKVNFNIRDVIAAIDYQTRK